MLPEMVRPFGVILSTCAAIIASQALVTGAFSLVSEPAASTSCPTCRSSTRRDQGQLYIPMVNNVMWVCVIVVLLVPELRSHGAAYGLAITITMICTSVLLFFYLHGVREMKVFPWAFVIFLRRA
mgnify:CR=1 FL=1